MVKESIIANKSYDFSLEIIKLTRILPKTYENIIIIKQIIRSATSVGANIEEALGSNSRKEFIHCMNISKKESRETLYWLRLASDINPKLQSKINSLMNENDEIIKILTKIVKTSSL